MMQRLARRLGYIVAVLFLLAGIAPAASADGIGTISPSAILGYDDGHPYFVMTGTFGPNATPYSIYNDILPSTIDVVAQPGDEWIYFGVLASGGADECGACEITAFYANWGVVNSAGQVIGLSDSLEGNFAATSVTDVLDPDYSGLVPVGYPRNSYYSFSISAQFDTDWTAVDPSIVWSIPQIYAVPGTYDVTSLSLSISGTCPSGVGTCSASYSTTDLNPASFEIIYPTPEPSSVWLLGAGLCGLFAFVRLRPGSRAHPPTD